MQQNEYYYNCVFVWLVWETGLSLEKEEGNDRLSLSLQLPRIPNHYHLSIMNYHTHNGETQKWNSRPYKYYGTCLKKKLRSAAIF